MSLDHYTVKDAPQGHELHHPHQLSLGMLGDDGQHIQCGLCKRPVERNTYVYKSWSDAYVLHKSCGDLPLKFNHWIHHPSDGPLNLEIRSWDRCCSCRLDRENTPFYTCNKCWFSMDVECARLAMAIPKREEGSIQHTTHPHPLLLIHHHDDGDEHCWACKLKVSGDEGYYGCGHCKYFLHKWCAVADFPLQFSQHPLHPHHQTLSMSAYYRYSYSDVTCNICDRGIGWSDFHFKCDDVQCGCRICWKCIITVKKKNIKYEDHEHLLSYVDRAEPIDRCNAYDAYCTRPDLINIVDNSEEFECTESSRFKCSECDLRLHFLCGPLPSSIKYDCHIHSLSLQDSVIEDDFGEYYCDVCETQRDPRIRIYHCNECKYFAHVHCLISEIVKVVMGDVEGVELNALGKDYWAHPTHYQTTSQTLLDLIHQLTSEEQEKRRLKSYYKWDDTWSKVNVGIVPAKERELFLNDDDEINKILQLSRFDATHFNTLINEFNEFLDKGERLELKSSDLGMKMVKVKRYMIPYPLAPVLQTLLDQYGDVAIRSIWSIEMKSFCYFLLCQTVKRMRATLVKDVTKHLLREWYLHLTFLNDLDFKIGFAVVQYKRLVDAYLGLQAETLEDEMPKKLNAKLAEIQWGLEKCKEYQGSSNKSEYMKYCMEKASKSRWLYSFDSSFEEEDEQSSLFPWD